MKYRLLPLLAAAAFVLGFGNIQQAAAGAPPSHEADPYAPRTDVRVRRHSNYRHRHPHQHYRGGSYPPTVMKNGRSYFYYPGTREQDRPAFRGDQHHTYKRQGPFRLFRLFDRFR